MQRGWARVWYGKSVAGALLAPLAGLYGAVSAARRLAYARGWLDTERVTRPVIVVGNLTAGGTGKTPVVAWLAAALAARGFAPGIVSRGYGGRIAAAGGVQSVAADSAWAAVGDEPLLLKRHTGAVVVVGRDRVAAAREAVRCGAAVVVCDDGLQHLRLARDCELIVVDGARGFGNRRLLPAGPLRERVARAAGAAAIIVNGAPEVLLARELEQLAGAAVFTMQLAPGAVCSLTGDRPARALEEFRGQRVHAIAGIGHPQRFFRELTAAGIEVQAHEFADHHPFTAAELAFDDTLPILMTEKDAVRCRAFATQRMWYVPVSARFSSGDERALLARVLERTGLSSRVAPQARP